MLHSYVMLAGLASPAEETGNPWWIWILVLQALTAFVGFMLWWWLRSDEEELAPHPAARPEPAAARAVEVEEVEAVPPAPDDLKRIEGIGPKISSVLQAAGIVTFAQLAATEVEQLRQILEAENPDLLRLADPSTWPEQAGLAAEGAWEALETLQDDLKGGRRA